MLRRARRERQPSPARKASARCRWKRLCTGYYETVLARDELITAVAVPPLGKKRAAYLKCTTRSADDWPALGLAVALETDGDAIRAATVFIGAATDKPTRLTAAESALRGARADEAALARAGRRGGRRARNRRRRAGLGRVQEAARARLSAARGARGARDCHMKRASTSTETPQVGRAIPRLESWQKVTGRAEYVHNLRLPGMLYGKIFRSTVPHGRIRRIKHFRGRGGRRRVPRRHRRRHPRHRPRALLRPGVPRPADPRDRQGALRRRAGGGGARFRSARGRGGGEPHRRRVRGAPRRLRRDRGDDIASDRARGAQAGRHLPRPEAPEGEDEHERRARLSPPARRRRAGARRCRSRLRAHLPHAAGDAHPARAARLGGRVARGLAHDPHRVAEPVVRPHRDRAAPRLAREPRPGARAVPRRRLRRQALYQARGAGRGARAPHPPPGEGVAHDGGAVLHHHQACDDVPDQERRDEGRPDHCARVRGVVERRRLCRHRAAGDAEVGLHRARPVRHRARRDRLVRALHEPAAGGRAARVRHPAARLGVREPHRHDRARAAARSARVPAEEPAARRSPAGDRAQSCRMRRSARSSTASRN